MLWHRLLDQQSPPNSRSAGGLLDSSQRNRPVPCLKLFLDKYAMQICRISFLFPVVLNVPLIRMARRLYSRLWEIDFHQISEPEFLSEPFVPDFTREMMIAVIARILRREAIPKIRWRLM